jgi:YHS domain-containing protein
MNKIFLFGIVTMLSTQAFSQTDKTELRKAQFNADKKQVAIKGYDAVTYFTTGKPKEGKPEFAVTYQGLSYYFISNENKELFKKNPTQYEPQYGGWCAYAMGNDGSKVEVDPETFKILNGKLFLFYNKYFTNTLKSWNKDEARLMKNADANWTKFYK